MTIGTTHRPLRDQVCDELRRLIMTGELPPAAANPRGMQGYAVGR